MPGTRPLSCGPSLCLSDLSSCTLEYPKKSHASGMRSPPLGPMRGLPMSTHSAARPSTAVPFLSKGAGVHNFHAGGRKLQQSGGRLSEGSAAWKKCTSRGRAFTFQPSSVAAEPARGAILSGDVAAQSSCDIHKPSDGKGRCDLCLLYFAKDSVTGVISLKRVLDLRRKWGVELYGRRTNTAAYMYDVARLCLFCTQFFDVSDDDTCDNSKQRPPVECTENITFERKPQLDPLSVETLLRTFSSRTMGRGPGSPSSSASYPLDLAFKKTVVMSSVADHCDGDIVVSGSWEPRDNAEYCCKTFTECEPWLEIDLQKPQFLKCVRILERVEKKGHPQMHRLIPFWVFLSRAPIMQEYLQQAKRTALHAVKVVKDERVHTIEVPSDLHIRFVRLQLEGTRSLQLAAVQVYKADEDPGGLNTARSANNGMESSLPPSPRTLFPPLDLESSLSMPSLPLDLPTAFFDDLAAQGAEEGPLEFIRAATAPSSSDATAEPQLHVRIADMMRPYTAVGAPCDASCASSSSASSHIKSLQEALKMLAKLPTSRGFTSLMAQEHVDNLIAQAVRRYRLKEEWERRLSRARSHYPPTELRPLTDHFVRLATGNGLLPGAPLEVLRVQSSSLVSMLLCLRGRTSAFKDIIGDGLSLEALNDALDSVIRVKKPHSKRRSFPTDYAQYLEILYCLRKKNATVSEVERIYEPYLRKLAGQERDLATRKKRRRKVVTTESIESILRERGTGGPLMNPEQRAMYEQVRHMLRHKEIVFKHRKHDIEHPRPRPVKETVVDWAKKQETRRQLQNQLQQHAPAPDITPRLTRKTCAVCLYQYPEDALTETVTIRSLANLLINLKLPPDKYATRLEYGMNMFARTPVCVFCNQLFDPDQGDGLAVAEVSKDQTGYQLFFDDRHPDRYSMTDPEMREKNRPEVLVKRAEAVVPTAIRAHNPRPVTGPLTA